MPSYTWACQEHHWIVMTSIATRDEPSQCPKCGAAGKRQFDAPHIDKTAAGGWNQQSFNPGLGCWTKSTRHGEQIAKSRGLEPVGNEPVENLHKHYDQKREETSAKRWRDADRDMVYGD